MSATIEATTTGRLGTTTPTTRVAPRQAVRNALTVAWRNLAAIRHNPLELLDVSVQPIMFVLLFAFVFGGAMAGSPQAYLEYGLAGIIVQNALFMSLYTAMGVNTDLGKGVFDRFRSLPIARSAPLAGRIAADVVRQVWGIAVLLGVGMLIGFRVTTGLPEVLLATGLVVLFVIAFSWFPLLIGIKVDSPEKVQMFGFVLVFPLTFASGAFVQVDTMPGWLQGFVRVNPVTQLSDAVRALLTGGAWGEPALISLLWAVGFAAVFAPLAIRALRRRA
ncbi:MAG TPA: ABC transporter permease [Actinomycetota bacterium]|nr:ABC transporter permease [Actinomycetota bacterium]